MKSIFSQDFSTKKEHTVVEGQVIKNVAATLSVDVDEKVKARGIAFAQEIENAFISDFEKTEKAYDEGKVNEVDKMVHVSTFCVINDIIYMTYYANTKAASEDPNNQTARLVYCPVENPDDKTFIDIQSVGDTCSGLRVNLVYDTILAKKDDETLYILWTAKVGDNYYRLYRSFSTKTKELGEVGVNRFKVGNIINDFSTTGMQGAMAENGVSYKQMYSDIGIMQKFTTRVENGEMYYYTGTYSGDFTCIIKSRDFITWEYVSQPDFLNESKWENATYVIGDKCYYFVRQQDTVKYGFLTVYNLVNKTWEKPVLIEDCQSRGDFIEYKGELYLFHAPIDRNHIGIVKIDMQNIANSKALVQAHMHTSCFYPFVQYYQNGELAMSYTVERKHIRLAGFTLEKYMDK